MIPLPQKPAHNMLSYVDAQRNPAEQDSAARARLVEALIATGRDDRAAFRTVYELTSAKLFGIVLRICNDWQASEEVLDDVFLIVWKRAGAYEPGRAAPITWLATIARNRAIDWCRATKRSPSTPLGEAPDVADDRPSVIDTLLRDERARTLHLCLDQIDEKQSAAIRAAFFDGLSYAEVAERQSVPLGTMKSWVRRGLRSLKEGLNEAA